MGEKKAQLLFTQLFILYDNSETVQCHFLPLEFIMHVLFLMFICLFVFFYANCQILFRHSVRVNCVGSSLKVLHKHATRKDNHNLGVTFTLLVH